MAYFPEKTVKTVTGTYSIVPQDSTVLVNSTGPPVTITLPVAADSTNDVFTIKRINTGVVQIDSAGGENIDNLTTYTLAALYDALTVVSDGTQWWIH